MSLIIAPNVALREITRQLIEGLEKQFQKLLEEKHLYQRVEFDMTELANNWRKQCVAEIHAQINYGVHHLKDYAVEVSVTQISTSVETPLKVRLSNVKMYCSNCERREAFAPLSVHEPLRPIMATPVAGGPRVPIANAKIPPGFVQYYLILYHCQSCLRTPEAVLIKLDRTKWSLSLEGRSPMEHVEIPQSIPRREEHLYRDALIAYQSGKILAGLFYLRAFIEQFARRVTGLSGKVTGEEIMATYTSTLGSLSGQMPSLREWYEKISAPLHDARDDDEVFGNALEAIDQHFNIRRVFKMPEKAAATSAEE